MDPRARIPIHRPERDRHADSRFPMCRLSRWQHDDAPCGIGRRVGSLRAQAMPASPRSQYCRVHLCLLRSTSEKGPESYGSRTVSHARTCLTAQIGGRATLGACTAKTYVRYLLCNDSRSTPKHGREWGQRFARSRLRSCHTHHRPPAIGRCGINIPVRHEVKSWHFPDPRLPRGLTDSLPGRSTASGKRHDRALPQRLDS